MLLKIQARNLKLDARAEEYARKKFERLERHLPSLWDARLEVSKTSSRSPVDRIVAQMTLAVKGNVLRGQERGDDMYSAVDALTDIMDRQIRRYKGKVYRNEQAKRARREAPPGALKHAPADRQDAPEEGEEYETPIVVRSKRFEMNPMTAEDAITEMDLLSHEFFLFYDSDSRELSLVYRRRDGGYGIIVPELA